MPPIGILFAGLFFSGTAAEPGDLGRRVDLGEAFLFIPHGVRSADGVVDLLFHLHGAPSVVEPAFVAAKWPGVLVEFNRKGLSRVYAEPFADPGLFPRLIDQALVALKDPQAAAAPRVGRLTVSSFSAGFGGVRELLKTPEHFAR